MDTPKSGSLNNESSLKPRGTTPVAKSPTPIKKAQSQTLEASKGIWLGLVLIALLAASIMIPWYFWYIAPELDLKLAVVDKTVPFEDKREHRGLYWLFEQNKIVDQAQAMDEKYYDYKEDYTGFDPNYGERGDKPDGIPLNSRTTLLSASDLDDRNVLYLADTYGVYEADYTQFEDESAHTRHSPKIFGGLEPIEVEAAERFAADGKLIIAEFNTFASPTERDLAERMEVVLGVTWTRWIGRYFTDFTYVKDVPEWLYELYNGSAEWEKRGRVDLQDETTQAFVLVRDESEDFIFLWDGEDIDGDDAITFIPREQYQNGDVMQGTQSCPVNYWVELLFTNSGTETLADYEFNLTRSGKNKMRTHNLKLIWPAITRWKSNYTAYYLVGDMSDFDKAMGSPRTRLTLHINRNYYGKTSAKGSQAFMYWNGYYPFVTNVLRLESNKLTGTPENIYLFD